MSIEADRFVHTALKRYGHALLQDRVLPDVTGLKPVHKRLVLAALEQKLFPGHPRKSAALVGAVLGMYHPHGDTAAYEAAVQMTGHRYPLFVGTGNFGSLEDRAAAHRYTEIELSPFAMEHVKDLDVVDTTPNYDEKRDECVTLNATLPLGLLNGSWGIGFGFRVGIPPHNLREVVDCLVAVLDDWNTASEDLVDRGLIKGPDYPEGGRLLSSTEELKEFYGSGTGSLRFGCDYEYRTGEDGHGIIAITSKTPGMDYSKLKAAMNERKAEGIIQDCAEVAINTPTAPQSFEYYVVTDDPQIWQRELGALTVKKINYACAFLAPAFQQGEYKGTKPVLTAGLAPMLRSFLRFRRQIERRVLQRDIAATEKSISKVEAEEFVGRNLDDVLDIWTNTKLNNKEDLVAAFLEHTPLTEEQIDHIYQLNMSRLTSFAQKDHEKTLQDLRKRLDGLKASLKNVRGLIREKLLDLKERYGDDRRTAIGPCSAEAPSGTSYSTVIMAGPDGRPKALRKTPSMSQLPNRRACGPQEALLTTTSSVFALISDDACVRQYRAASVNSSTIVLNGCIGVAGRPGVLVVVTRDGRYAAIPFPQKKVEYQAAQFPKVVFGESFNADDFLVVEYEDASQAWMILTAIPVSKLKTWGRPNVKGGTLPRRTTSRKGTSVIRAYRVPAGAEVRSRNGRALTLNPNEVTRERLKRSMSFRVFSDRTLGLLEESVKVGDYRTLAVDHRRGRLLRSWPL